MLGPREFEDPETGEVRVLTKRSRFGGHTYPRKTGATGQGGGNTIKADARTKGRANALRRRGGSLISI